MLSVIRCQFTSITLAFPPRSYRGMFIYISWQGLKLFMLCKPYKQERFLWQFCCFVSTFSNRLRLAPWLVDKNAIISVACMCIWRIHLARGVTSSLSLFCLDFFFSLYWKKCLIQFLELPAFPLNWMRRGVFLYSFNMGYCC